MHSSLNLKKGKIHDEQREEIEIKCKKEDFETLENLFKTLNYKIKIKWFRKRNAFKLNDITIALDYTKGYGYIIELEKIAEESTKDAALKELREKMQNLGIELTPKEEFDKAYEYYKNNWQTII